MNKRPKITIVTCVYNLFEVDRVETFRQTMESVHNQTYENIEHIIINNNSTDDTQKLVDEYVAKGWATCYFQPIQGLWYAMQKGYEVANGDFINFMNSDDFFSFSNSVEKAVEKITEEKADWFYSDTYSLETNGDINYWKGDIELVPFGQCMCHQSMYVSMDVMREFGGFDFNYELSLDNHMMLKLILNNKKAAYIAEPLVTFRRGGWSSQQKIKAFRNDYAINFFDQVGKSLGLTLEECKDIWMLSVFQEKGETYCKKLGKKIINQKWKKTYFDRYKNYKKSMSKIYYLFSVLPFIKVKRNSYADKYKYYLFGILIFTKTKI